MVQCIGEFFHTLWSVTSLLYAATQFPRCPCQNNMRRIKFTDMFTNNANHTVWTVDCTTLWLTGDRRSLCSAAAIDLDQPDKKQPVAVTKRTIEPSLPHNHCVPFHEGIHIVS